MQQVEALDAVFIVAGSQIGHFAAGVIEDFQIALALFLLAVGPVAEQRVVNLAARIGEVVDFEIAHEFVDAVAVADQCRHNDQRAGFFWNAVLEFVADQTRRRQVHGDEEIEEAGGAFRSRQREHQKQQDGLGPAHAGMPHEIADDAERHDGQEEHRSCDRQPVELAPLAHEAHRNRCTVADRLFQLLGLLTHDEIADIRLTRLPFARCLGGLGHRHGDLGDLHFGLVGTAGKLFDATAVAVARARIELGVVGLVPQQLVDSADFFDPDGPVGIVNETQALDDVAHRHIA